MQNAPDGRQHESRLLLNDSNTGRTKNNLYISFYLENVMNKI